MDCHEPSVLIMIDQNNETATISTNSHNNKSWLGVVVAIMRLSLVANNYHNDKYRIMRLPRLFQSLVMTMWVYCHCERSEVIHKPLITNIKTEKKKKLLSTNKQK